MPEVMAPRSATTMPSRWGPLVSRSST